MTREAVLRLHGQGLTPRAIGELLGMRRTAVTSALWRARQPAQVGSLVPSESAPRRFDVGTSVDVMAAEVVTGLRDRGRHSCTRPACGDCVLSVVFLDVAAAIVRLRQEEAA